MSACLRARACLNAATAGLTSFRFSLSNDPVEVEAVDEGAHGVTGGVRNQSLIQHFLQAQSHTTNHNQSQSNTTTQPHTIKHNQSQPHAVTRSHTQSHAVTRSHTQSHAIKRNHTQPHTTTHNHTQGRGGPVSNIHQKQVFRAISDT